MNQQAFNSARKDKKLAVLEGFHALKHALRFKADIIASVAPNKPAVLRVADALSPDIVKQMDEIITEVSEEDYNKTTARPPRSGVISIAKRDLHTDKEISDIKSPIVWLDDPRDHENIGAVIRVSAGGGAGAVVVTGDIDPWSPGCIRGSAGLHYALPIIKTNKFPSDFGKKIIVFDPEGKPMDKKNIPRDSILVFGSERGGVSEQIKAHADEIISIPMRLGVSSLNLATSVAVGLYTSQS